MRWRRPQAQGLGGRGRDQGASCGPAGLSTPRTQDYSGGGGEGECCLAFLIFHDPKLSHGTLSSRCYAGKHSDGFSRRYDTMPQ